MSRRTSSVNQKAISQSTSMALLSSTPASQRASQTNLAAAASIASRRSSKIGSKSALSTYKTSNSSLRNSRGSIFRTSADGSSRRSSRDDDRLSVIQPDQSIEQDISSNAEDNIRKSQAHIEYIPSDNEGIANLVATEILRASDVYSTHEVAVAINDISTEFHVTKIGSVLDEEAHLPNNTNFKEIELLYESESDQIIQEMDIIKILQSPPPEVDEGYAFQDVDYEVDLDLPIIQMCTAMTRSNSWDYGIELTPTSVYDAEIAVPITLILRPSTPLIEEHIFARDTELDSANSPHDFVPVPADNIDREALINDIRKLLKTKEKYQTKNISYQNLLSEYLRHEAHDAVKSASDQEKRYLGCMQTLNDLQNHHQQINSTNQRAVNDFKVKLQDRIDEASERTMEFCKYKRTVALNAENSRTGKSPSIKLVEQIEAIEQRKETEVVAIRLENIKLRNKLKRDEALLRQKEELADGLHLIDFEQLKIENQTYNEKIEERNEDLLKLRKKITNVVQELTHVKEKLQFVKAETVMLKETLITSDRMISIERDQLPIAKQQRDQLRLVGNTLKQKNGLLGNIPLLKDFEEMVDLLKEKSDEINMLRDSHQMLAAESFSIKLKIQKAQLLL